MASISRQPSSCSRRGPTRQRYRDANAISLQSDSARTVSLQRRAHTYALQEDKEGECAFSVAPEELRNVLLQHWRQLQKDAGEQ
eukprot:scaffold705_cov402-Prasinococcus_capsulatus_cf.AAC.34